MPFAGFKDFEACMKKMRGYYSEEVAEKVCGKLKSEFEKIDEMEKDQMGSVGFGGVIDANMQIKRNEHMTGEVKRNGKKKKNPPQSGEFQPSEDVGGVYREPF